ncbi:transcription elongation GreA/GreB family factor [Haloferula luteola]|uniref:Transcription elongation GreA/GreB family factor n=1 Tax=Haloferula luteola TaxID=595692 RepID=A0A840V1B7_9BACT|nr:GreA/GreB family elongation factor [Haloferula luteola]MBB5351792.1 transcription elongation GreA/GreB family factor [Haloferula luteola]
MHPDLEKLVDAGRLQPAIAERLDQVAPGKFLLHNAWGAGKVIAWDLPAKKLTIDFEHQRGQQMDLQFAIQKTLPLADDDFRSKKVENIEHLRELAQNDPVALVVFLLESHEGSMTVDAMEKELSGSVVEEAAFKKWWDATKRALRDSKRVIVPARRTEQLNLRNADLTPAKALIGDFEESRDLKSMSKALEAIVADLSLFKAEVDSLRPVLTVVDDAAKKGTRMQLGLTLELLSLRDELIGSMDALVMGDDSLRLANLLLAEEARLGEELGSLSTARQRAIYEVFPEAFGERWVDALLNIFDSVGTRGVAEIARIIDDKGKSKELSEHLRGSLARRSLGPDPLIWIVRERRGVASDVFSPEIGAAILNLLETDHLSDGPRKTTRLQSLLSDDKGLLADIVAEMGVTEARNFARRLLECPVFADLDRKSLMARIIKAKPETGELVSGDRNRREEPLVVSWASLERKQAEMDDLLRNRIPQNTKDIAIARSYGDLRENFEYKSAKDMQKVLMRRKTELQRELDRARGTDFKGADPSAVNIGTIVTLKSEEGEDAQFTVLGAWDSDPEKHIVSYLSEAGAALFHKKVGDRVEIRDHETDLMKAWNIASIAPYVS